MQFVYYKAVAVINAATATILQFLSPVFIVVHTMLRERAVPRRADLIAVLVALVGIFLLVTGGQPTYLAISPAAFFWGLATGMAAAAYVLSMQLVETGKVRLNTLLRILSTDQVQQPDHVAPNVGYEFGAISAD